MRPIDRRDDLAHLAQAPARGLLREYWDFLRTNRKWWLLPILLTLLMLGFAVAFGGTVLAPAIYALF
jgi:hypothetical protein